MGVINKNHCAAKHNKIIAPIWLLWLLLLWLSLLNLVPHNLIPCSITCGISFTEFIFSKFHTENANTLVRIKQSMTATSLQEVIPLKKGFLINILNTRKYLQTKSNLEFVCNRATFRARRHSAFTSSQQLQTKKYDVTLLTHCRCIHNPKAQVHRARLWQQLNNDLLNYFSENLGLVLTANTST